MEIITDEEFDAIKGKLARSLREELLKDALTPNGEKHVDVDVRIPHELFMRDPDKPGTVQAAATYTVKMPDEKKHTVYLQFRYDKNGNLVKNSITYV
jgi:hypothetical protein